LQLQYNIARALNGFNSVPEMHSKTFQVSCCWA